MAGTRDAYASRVLGIFLKFLNITLLTIIYIRLHVRPLQERPITVTTVPRYLFKILSFTTLLTIISK
jgi:hypothetical protein